MKVPVPHHARRGARRGRRGSRTAARTPPTVRSAPGAARDEAERGATCRRRSAPWRCAAPILTASGTSGHDDELAAYGDLAELGAVVVKSLAAFAWKGNPAPRVAPAGEGMLNAVGPAGPRRRGVARRRAAAARARAARRSSRRIWGRTVDEFAAAAEALRGAPSSPSR